MSGSGLWRLEHGPIDGPLVVLVHGSMDRAAGFAKVVRRLHDCRVITYDRRGYGHSRVRDEDPARLSMDAHARDLLDVIDNRPVTVVGHSLGGVLALMAAARRPDLVRSVAVYEPPLSWMDWWPPATAGGDAAAVPDPSAAAERFLRRMLGDDRWEGLPERTRVDRRAEGLALVTELRDVRVAAPFEWSEVRAPALSGCGERSAPHHIESGRRVSERLGCPLVVIADAGHGAPASHPEEFAALVAATVARGSD